MKKLINKYLPLAYGAYFNTLAIFSGKRAAQKAFILFCTPRKGRILPSQQSFLSAAEHKVEQFGTHQIQTYRWPGHKETILLLHGWESNSFRWHKLIGFLQKEDYNIIAIDAPAHGKSSGKILTAPLYTEWIHHVVQEYLPDYMVAHSFGGMAALYQQYKYPDKTLKKIVTIGSPSELSEFMSQYKKILKYNSTVTAALDDYIMDTFGFRPNDFSTAAFARRISTSGLLIHDELDTVTPVISSERVHANWKNSRLIKTKGLGHSMHQEKVNKHIIDFLKS